MVIKSIYRKKNTISLPISIFIIILLIISIYCIVYKSNQYPENFADPIGEFDFLAPVTETISDELWNILANNMNKVNDTQKYKVDKLKKDYTNFVTKDEISYYLENGIFPWIPHVKKVLVEAIMKNSKRSDSNTPQTISGDDIITRGTKESPNRYVYSQYLLMPNITENIKGDAYLIYSGEKPAPTKGAGK